MKRQIFVFLLLGLILLNGCVSDSCPADYKVVSSLTDRTRCYKTMYSPFPVMREVEVSCPLACIEAVK